MPIDLHVFTSTCSRPLNATVILLPKLHIRRSIVIYTFYRGLCFDP